MQKKLQELTDKIYQEGVDKANQEAEKIISDAKADAKKTLDQAKKEAENKIEKAEKEAEDLKKNAMNELQLSARQAMSDLKQEVTDLIQAKAVKPETQEAFKEAAFTKEIIQTVVKNWDPNSDETVDLKVLLPEKRQKEFESYFKDKAKDLLNKGLEVDFDERVKGGFKIGPKDGSYLVSFSDEDFEHFFKLYLRPRLIEMLFGEEGSK